MRLIDWLADWLRDSLTARARVRFGIITILVSIPWTIGAIFFTGEPVNVILMSGSALVLTGVTIVISAEVMEQGE